MYFFMCKILPQIHVQLLAVWHFINSFASSPQSEQTGKWEAEEYFKQPGHSGFFLVFVWQPSNMFSKI